MARTPWAWLCVAALLPPQLLGARLPTGVLRSAVAPCPRSAPRMTAEPAGDGDDVPSETDVSQSLNDELKRRELDGDDTGLDAFNSELYDHLKRRPEFADRVLYNELSNRVDVEEEVFNSWRDHVDASGKLEPTAGQTPGEIIQIVLRALQDCDYPHTGHGVEVLQRFSSDACIASAGKINAEMLYRYIEESKFRILTDWVHILYSKKLDTSLEGTRAYQEVRLKRAGSADWQVVNFMFGLYDGVWMIDHIRVRGVTDKRLEG